MKIDHNNNKKNFKCMKIDYNNNITTTKKILKYIKKN